MLSLVVATQYQDPPLTKGMKECTQQDSPSRRVVVSKAELVQSTAQRLPPLRLAHANTLMSQNRVHGHAQRAPLGWQQILHPTESGLVAVGRLVELELKRGLSPLRWWH